MKECCETGEPRKKRYWHWVALGCVLVLAVALENLPGDFGYYHPDGSAKAQADLVAIVEGLDHFANNNRGKYPSSLQPLVMPDTNGNAYLEGFNGKIPKDSWKREYQYQAPTPDHPRPRVWSLGADGKRGGTGDDADIDSDKVLGGSR